MQFLRTRLAHLALACALTLALVLALSTLSTPRASASALGGNPCGYGAPYAPPAAVWVDSEIQALRVGWVACDTHEVAGPYTFEIWVAPTNELLSTMAGPTNGPGIDLYTYAYARPLIPAPSYTFWVMQCFTDATCTGWSNPVTGSFPDQLWWL